MKDYKKIYANKFRGFMMNSNSVRKQIKVLAAGAKVLGISKSNISKVKMPLPSLPEQTKIADFLSTVDEKIQNQKDKITHLENIKKGFMQKIFSRKIRFKDDGGEEFPEWEEKKLGEFIVGFNEKSIIENQYPILTSSSKGLMLQKEYFKDRQVTTKNNIGYNILPRGYITYRNRSDCGKFTFNLNNIIDKGIISYFYPVFKLKGMNTVFGLVYMNNYLDKQIKIESVGTSQLVLSINKLKQMNIKVPCLEEQQKIANFLSSFNEKISIEKEILGHLKQLKKGLLQQMFV